MSIQRKAAPVPTVIGARAKVTLIVVALASVPILLIILAAYRYEVAVKWNDGAVLVRPAGGSQP